MAEEVNPDLSSEFTGFHKEDPNHVEDLGSINRMPMSPRFHVTSNEGPGTHSLDDFNPDFFEEDNQTAAEEVFVRPLKTLTPSQPTTYLPQKRAYKCHVRNASMHREDGKRMAFTGPHNILITDIKEDVEFLETELHHQNPYIRRATKEEVSDHLMALNPKKFMREQVRSEMTPQIRQQIEHEERARLEAEITARVKNQYGINDTDRIAGVDPAPVGQKVDVGGGTLTLQPTRLQGITNTKALEEGAMGPNGTVGNKGSGAEVGADAKVI